MIIRIEVDCEKCYDLEKDDRPQVCQEDWHESEARMYLLCPRCKNASMSVSVELLKKEQTVDT